MSQNPLNLSGLVPLPGLPKIIVSDLHPPPVPNQQHENDHVRSDLFLCEYYFEDEAALLNLKDDPLGGITA